MNIYEHIMVGQPIDRGNFFVYSVYDNVGSMIPEIKSDWWNYCSWRDEQPVLITKGSKTCKDLLRGLQIIERLVHDEYI